MENTEEILAALDEFNRKAVDKVPPLLERYLDRIATTGETLFAWSKLRPLLVHKLDSVMKEFYERDPTDNLGPCPNVQNIKFEEMRERLLLIINEFTGAPFTIQRLCELATNPEKHYKQTDKLMRGIAKNLLVVSTVDPYGNKIMSEASKVLVNGMDANGYEGGKMSPETPPRSFFPPPTPASSPTANGTTNSNNTATSSMSPLASNWFSSAPAADSVSPWGGGSGILGVKPTDGSGDADSRLEGAAPSEPEPSEPGSAKDIEVSETSSNSSSSSGSSSSSELAALPLGEVDKDSGDSNESVDTSESSSSSDGSLNDTEVERQQGDLPSDTILTSPTQSLSLGEGDFLRDTNKRPLENPENSENKRPRLSEEGLKDNSEECPPSDAKLPTDKTPEVPEETKDEAEEQNSDSVTSVSDDVLATPSPEDTTPVAEGEELRERQDSQDSLGFDSPFEGEMETSTKDTDSQDDTDQSEPTTENSQSQKSSETEKELHVPTDETEAVTASEETSSKTEPGESPVTEKQTAEELTEPAECEDTALCPQSTVPPVEQEESKKEGETDQSDTSELSQSEESTDDVTKPQDTPHSPLTTDDKEDELESTVQEADQSMETE